MQLHLPNINRSRAFSSTDGPTQKSANLQQKTPEIRRFQVFSGAAGRIRTADLILTNARFLFFLIFFVVYGHFRSRQIASRHFLDAEFPVVPPLSVAGYVVKFMRESGTTTVLIQKSGYKNKTQPEAHAVFIPVLLGVQQLSNSNHFRSWQHRSRKQSKFIYRKETG